MPALDVTLVAMLIERKESVNHHQLLALLTCCSPHV